MPENLQLSREEARAHISRIPDGALDLVFPAILRTLEQWRARADVREGLVVHHDESNLVARAREAIEYLGHSDRDPISAKSGPKFADVEYPLELDSIRLVKSEKSAAIQLADIIAGFLTDFASGAYNEEERAVKFVEALGEAGSLHDVIPRPTTDPEELGLVGTDANKTLDYFATQMLEIDRS